MNINYDELKAVLKVAGEKSGESESFWIIPSDLDLEISKNKIYFYAELLEDDGFVEICDRLEQTHEMMFKRLTASGYRAFEAMNNNKIWDKIKDRVQILGEAGMKEIPALAIKAIVGGLS